MVRAKPNTDPKAARRPPTTRCTSASARRSSTASWLPITDPGAGVRCHARRQPYPVREALVRLANEDWSRCSAPGARIIPIPVSDMRSIYDVLIALEPRAAELLPSGATEEELRLLEVQCERMTETLTRGEMEEWALADEEFHLNIVRFCGNERLADIVLNCWDSSQARTFTPGLRQILNHPDPSKSTTRSSTRSDAAIQGGDRELSQPSRTRLKEQTAVMMAFRIHQPDRHTLGDRGSRRRLLGKAQHTRKKQRDLRNECYQQQCHDDRGEEGKQRPEELLHRQPADCHTYEQAEPYRWGHVSDRGCDDANHAEVDRVNAHCLGDRQQTGP